MSVTEDELKERALAPRVTFKDVEDAILAEYYFTARDGIIGSGARSIVNGSRINLGTLTFAVLVLKNGYTVTGQSACADPTNYKQDIGERIARSDAVNKIWPLLGYELKTKLTEGN